jgi:hypothetical protein
MSSGGNRTWRRTLVLWAVPLIFCAAVAGVSRAAEASRRRAYAEQWKQLAQSDGLHPSVRRFRGHPVEAVEAALNGGKPLARTDGPDDPKLKLRVVLPGAALGRQYEGWVVRLTFHRLPAPPVRSGPLGDVPLWQDELDGMRGQVASHGNQGARWRYYLVSYSAAPPPRHEGPSPATLALLARLRRVMIVFGTAGWVIAVLTLPFARRWRRQVAQVMLACVLVVGVGWAAEPGRDLSFAALLKPVPAALELGTLASLCALLPRVRRVSTDAPHCDACGYDLTGNVSGVCSECGSPTARGKVERWRGIAEQIEHVGEPEEVDEIAMPPAEPA